MKMKICPGCKEEYPYTEEYFYNNKTMVSGLTHYCKSCMKRNTTRSGNRSEEKILKLQHMQRINLFKKTYSLTEQDVRDLMDLFKGTCHICGKSLVTPESQKSYAIDHDHKTGEIRGLLCKLCNVGLGHFQDSPELLEKAAQYLRDHR